MVNLLRIAGLLVEDAFRWLLLLFRSAEALRAENLFLRRQLPLYIERGGGPQRVDAATRISLALLARLFDWRGALVVVQPGTMIRWHRAGWRLHWRMKSPARSVAAPEGTARADPHELTHPTQTCPSRVLFVSPIAVTGGAEIPDLRVQRRRTSVSDCST